jgi:adenylate kinase family enzyme
MDVTDEETHTTTKHIDFIGLPASGKTTVCESLVLQSMSELIPYNVGTIKTGVSKYRKYPIYLLLFFRNIKDIIFVVVFFIKNTTYEKVNYSCFCSISKLLFQTEYELLTGKNDFFVNNGVFHHIILVKFKGRVDEKQSLQSFWNHFKYKCDLVVLNTIDEDLYLDRIIERSNNNQRFASFLYQVGRQSWLTRTYRQYSLLVACIKQDSAPLLVLKSEDSVEFKTAQCKTYLENSFTTV